MSSPRPRLSRILLLAVGMAVIAFSLVGAFWLKRGHELREIGRRELAVEQLAQARLARRTALEIYGVNAPEIRDSCDAAPPFEIMLGSSGCTSGNAVLVQGGSSPGQGGSASFYGSETSGFIIDGAFHRNYRKPLDAARVSRIRELVERMAPKLDTFRPECGRIPCTSLSSQACVRGTYYVSYQADIQVEAHELHAGILEILAAAPATDPDKPVICM
ncbi:MAG: hypothetical protein ACREO7_05990 [Pseudoxanthomonas sp.]